METYSGWFHSFAGWNWEILWQEGLTIFLSYENQLIAIIYILYFYKCVLFVSVDEPIIEYNSKQFKLIFAIDKIKLGKKYLLFINPLLFFRPIFHIKLDGKVENTYKYSRKFIKKNRLVITLLKKIIPIVFVIWILLLIVLPISLLYIHEGFILLSGLLLYISIILLLLQIWIMRKQLKISNKQFTEILFEYILCPPFSINAIRDISISTLSEQGTLNE